MPKLVTYYLRNGMHIEAKVADDTALYKIWTKIKEEGYAFLSEGSFELVLLRDSIMAIKLEQMPTHDAPMEVQ
jgi:hypothetical protein